MTTKKAKIIVKGLYQRMKDREYVPTEPLTIDELETIFQKVFYDRPKDPPTRYMFGAGFLTCLSDGEFIRYMEEPSLRIYVSEKEGKQIMERYERIKKDFEGDKGGV